MSQLYSTITLPFIVAFAWLHKMPVAFVMSVHLSMCNIALPTGQTSVKFDIEGFCENLQRKSRSVEEIEI